MKFNPVATYLVSNLMPTPARPVFDGESWRELMADIVAHRYRAAAQIEAPYCLSCWRDFFAEQEHDFDDRYYFLIAYSSGAAVGTSVGLR